MRISVFGLGYVGSVTAACLAKLGHDVMGVDIHPAKVEAMAAGQPPVLEEGLDSILGEVLSSGRLTVTTDTIAAIEASEMSIIAVGTPSSSTGAVDLRSVQRCVESIAGVLRHTSDRHCIVIRSTVPPGTTDRMLGLAAELSGRDVGNSLLGGMNPESLREGSAVEDFFQPAVVVIGASDRHSSRTIAGIYGGLENPEFAHMTPREAELVKYTNNAFHAVKVTFANEIDRIAESFGVDAGKVMEVVRADRKLNISEKYLRPGFAFGGSCLPKDVRAINRLADINGVKAPMLESLLRSNTYHVNAAMAKVNLSGPRRVGLLGLTFKPKTDDVRESPALALAAMLLEGGYDLLVHDCNFRPEELIGASRSFIQDEFPDLGRYWKVTAEEVVLESDLVIVANPEEAYLDALEDADVEVLDLSKSVSLRSPRPV